MTARDCFDVGEWWVPLCNTLELSALCLVCVGHCLFSTSLVSVQSFGYTVLVGFSVSFRACENKGCPKAPFSLSSVLSQ